MKVTTTMTPTKNAIAMTAASTRVLSLIGLAGWYGWRSGNRSGAVRAPAFAALRDDLCRYLFCAHASTVTLTVTSANKELEITGVLLLRMAEKVR